MSRQMKLLQTYAAELRKQLETKERQLEKYQRWDFVDPKTSQGCINRCKKSIQHTLDVIADIERSIEQLKINQQYDKQRWTPQA